jgi:hypothetical protein
MRENILAMVERSAWRMMHPVYTLVVIAPLGSTMTFVPRRMGAWRYALRKYMCKNGVYTRLVKCKTSGREVKPL